MDKHISLARELGYEGQELRDLKRQQDLEREERLAQRNMKERKGRPSKKIKKGSKKIKKGSKKRKIGSKKIRIENWKS